MFNKDLKKAFIAGFVACSGLPEEVEVTEGSIEKTVDRFFEHWMNQSNKQDQ